MPGQATIHQFQDFKTAELFAIFRHIYLTSDFMSEDFDMKFPGVEQFSDYYQNILKKKGSFILIAKIENRPVGYVVIEAGEAVRLRHTAWLNMGIVQGYRNRGIGGQLLNAALNKARTEGRIEIIYLMVRADHTSAIKLYLNAGFAQLARLEKDTKIGAEYYDGLLMRRFV